MVKSILDIRWQDNPDYGKDGNRAKKFKHFVRFTTVVRKYKMYAPSTYTRYYDSLEEAMKDVRKYCKAHGFEHQHFVTGRETVKVKTVTYELSLEEGTIYFTDDRKEYHVGHAIED